MTTNQPDARTSAERMLDDLDPESLEWRDAVHLRGIMRANENRVAASDALGSADAALHAAVASARSAGDSWTLIGAALGVTRQAAQQRFGKDEGRAVTGTDRPAGGLSGNRTRARGASKRAHRRPTADA